MTESIAKKIGFGLLVLGLLTGWSGMAAAQQTLPPKQAGESQADYNRRVAAANNQAAGGKSVTATQHQAGGIGDNMLTQQAANSLNGVKNSQPYNLQSNAGGNIVAGAANNLQGAGKIGAGILTLDGQAIKNGAQQMIKGTGQQLYGVAQAGQDALNMNLPIVGSVTGHLGDRVAGTAIRMGGDEMAQAVAVSKGISAENADKISAAKGGGFLGTGFMSRDALTYKLPDGSTVNMDANLNSTEGMMEGCMPIPVKLDQMKNCIFCPLFLVLYNTAEAMATASFDVLASGFKTLLIIGFALYIAYMTLKQVSAFTKQDAPKYITEALTMAFKVFLAWLLLSNGPELYRLGLEPLLSAGIEFGQSFLTHQNATGTNTTADIASCATSVGAISGADKPFYSHLLYEKIDCYLRKVTQEIAVSQSIGSSLMCVARHKASGVVMWDLTMFITGLIMWLFAWLICLAFSFYLIDSVIRLGIIGAITPFLIAAWPFKVTQGYTGKGWSMFLNAFFVFVFLGLVVSVNVELSAQSATGGATVITGEGDSQVSSSGVDAILALVNSNDIEALLEVMSIGLSGLIFMILCCVFGFKLCAESAALAGEMGTSGGSNIGSKVGSMAYGAAKGVTTGAAKTAWSGAKIVGEATGASDGLREMGDKVHQGFNNAVKKGMGKLGIGRFSATAAGRLNNQGMAQNTGSGAPNSAGAPDNDADDANKLNNSTMQTPQQQPNKPAEEAMLDQMIARGGMSSDQENAALNAAIAAQSQRQKPTEEAMLDEMIKSGKFDEEQLDKVLDDGIAQERARTAGKESGEREAAQAKADIAAAAAGEAEKASRVAAGSNGGQRNSDDSGDKKDKDKNSGADAKMRDELDATKLTISQLRTEIDDLKKQLRQQGATSASSAGNSDMAERVKKLEEELKRRGGSL